MPSPASPITNQFKCNACGRFFNTEAELHDHETLCRAAKQATRQGAEELKQEDTNPIDHEAYEGGVHPERR